MEHERPLLLLPAQVLVQEPLHLLVRQVPLLHVPPEELRVRVEHVHSLVVDAHVRHVLVRDVVRRVVPRVDVVDDVSLARRELRDEAPVRQSHVLEAGERRLGDHLSVRRLLACRVEPDELRPLLRVHPSHLAPVDIVEVRHVLAQRRSRLPLLVKHLVHNPHIRENGSSRALSLRVNVRLLLSDFGPALLRLVKVILVSSELRDLRGIEELDKGPGRKLQGEVFPYNLLRNPKGRGVSHPSSQLRVVADRHSVSVSACLIVSLSQIERGIFSCFFILRHPN